MGLDLDTVTISPLEWGPWSSWNEDTYNMPIPRGYKPLTISPPPNTPRKLLAHCLAEEGQATNGYRYTIYSKGRALLDVRFRVPCCEKLPTGKCPLKGRVPLPTECREALRESAISTAQEHYAQWIKDMAGGI